MSFSIIRLLASISLLCWKVHGFVVQPFGLKKHTSIATSLSFAPEIGSKFFQLEELEDRYSCVTEIFLRNDNTLDVIETDGPLPSESKGTWQQSDDGSFVMMLERTFKTGHNGTDMGEFSFCVERTFVGEMSEVGGLVAVSGRALDYCDIVGNRQVGVFSLIDTTESKSGSEKEPKKGLVSYAF